MVDLAFYPFIIGFATIVIIISADAVFGGRVGHHSTITGPIAFASYAVLLYVAWGLWKSLDPLGSSTISLSASPFSTSLQLNLAGVFMFVISSVLGLAATAYSIRYLINYRNSALFHSLLVLLPVTIYGVVVSGDLLTLFIFWEGMSICCYGLVAFRKNSSEALEAAIKYLLLAGTGSLVALYGIAVIYSSTGTLNLVPISSPVLSTSPAILLGLALIIAGFGVEAAIAPLHTWLPDAHPAAPSPMSAVLSGIVIETGSFTILRIITGSFLDSNLVRLIQPLFVAFALTSMIIGNFSAYFQDDLKRLLAFSSVAQVGYILLGISTFTQPGISASLFQIWNHALLKGLFFLLAGIVSFSIGTRSLTEMSGIGRKWPLLGLLVSLDALALTGVPPFGMFWSELLIIFSTIATGSILLLLGALGMLLNIAFSIGYYFRIIRHVVFEPQSEYLNKATVKPRSWIMLAPCIALLALSVITGLYPDLIYQPASRAIQLMMSHR